MKKIFSLIVLLMLFAKFNSYSADCIDTLAPLYSIQKSITFPVYNTGMPYNILIGWIATDSICYNAQLNNVVDFFKRQNTLNDTLKTIFKYYYNMVDYDPIEFYKATFYNDSNISTKLSKIDNLIIDKVLSISDNPALDYQLMNSHYILHIRINDTITNIDTSENSTLYLKNVNATVIDTIKGKKYISCNINYPKIDILDMQNIANNSICFYFLPNWGRDESKLFVNMKPDDEYICFLSMVNRCKIDNEIITVNRPLLLDGNNYSPFMFKIENGIVIDEKNRLGLGTNNTVEQFIYKLKNRINYLTN